MPPHPELFASDLRPSDLFCFEAQSSLVECNASRNFEDYYAHLLCYDAFVWPVGSRNGACARPLDSSFRKLPCFHLGTAECLPTSNKTLRLFQDARLMMPEGDESGHSILYQCLSACKIALEPHLCQFLVFAFLASLPLRIFLSLECIYFLYWCFLIRFWDVLIFVKVLYQ